jgi:hypothetical protein
MNIALFAAPGIWAPLQGLLRRLTPGCSTTAGHLSTPIIRPHSVAPNSIAGRSHSTGRIGTNAFRAAQRRPLRVVRIMEAGQTPAQVGRMVMSGRMADICAELDRLAACEAARH